MSENLNALKAQLSQMKTQWAIEDNKMREALADLHTEFGITDINAAVIEYDNITKNTIPQLVAKRDEYIAQAEDIINGIDTGHATIPEAGGGIARGTLGRTTTPVRRPVGIKREH